MPLPENGQELMQKQFDIKKRESAFWFIEIFRFRHHTLTVRLLSKIKHRHIQLSSMVVSLHNNNSYHHCTYTKNCQSYSKQNSDRTVTSPCDKLLQLIHIKELLLCHTCVVACSVYPEILHRWHIWYVFSSESKN